jgi:hypothetical protein
MDGNAKIIAFPGVRTDSPITALRISGKDKIVPLQEAASLEASVKRHPAKGGTPVPETPAFIAAKDILPAGMQTTNIDEIEYRIQRLDAVLAHMGAQNSPADMKRLVKHIKEAMYSTAEITYFEGLAEGYTSYEEEED